MRMPSYIDLDRIRRANEALRDGSARQRRVAAGWTQQRVGEFCGVEQCTVAAWEAGRRRPRGDAAARLGGLLERLDHPAGTRQGA